MNWLLYLLSGSSEFASSGDTPKEENPSTATAKNEYSFEDERSGYEDERSSYVPLDETMGDPFAD